MMLAFLQNLESFPNASLRLIVRFAFGTFRFGRNAFFQTTSPIHSRNSIKNFTFTSNRF